MVPHNMLIKCETESAYLFADSMTKYESEIDYFISVILIINNYHP